VRGARKNAKMSPSLERLMGEWLRNSAAMNGMRRSKRPGWATLFVLGALFLRALVPAGFMLAPGRLELVLCDVEMSAGELGGHHHHHPGHDNAAHHDGVHGDPTCPYAQSAGPAPLPSLPVLAAGSASSDQLAAPTSVTQTLLSFGPPRQQSSRGPPHLA
jgi:hypothetical protein